MFNKIHTELLKRSKNLKFLNEQISENGTQKITAQKLDFFSFFVKTIISQQINYLVAKRIWSKLENLFRMRKLSAYNYFKQTPRKKILNEIPLSKSKISYIINIRKALEARLIEEEKLKILSNKKFSEKFQKLKGVGPWTCNMYLIFFYQRLNVWPKNDLVINKVKNYILKTEAKNVNFEIQFSPYLSVLAMHFWKINSRILLKNCI